MWLLYGIAPFLSAFATEAFLLVSLGLGHCRSVDTKTTGLSSPICSLCDDERAGEVEDLWWFNGRVMASYDD